jgi:hypothetical protein
MIMSREKGGRANYYKNGGSYYKYREKAHQTHEYFGSRFSATFGVFGIKKGPANQYF